MNFLKRLFGGARPAADDGLYYYFRSRRSGEVVQVRLNPHADLSQLDDNEGFYVRKVIVGTKSFERMEAEFFFDRNRRLLSCDVTGGELVERADYDAYRAANPPGQPR